MLFALLRYCVASVLLIPLALARGGLAKLPKPVPWKTLVLMALSGVGIYYVLFNLALAYTTASQTALIQSAFPAIVAIMAVVMLHERVDRRRMLGIALAIVGVVLIVLRTEPGGDARDPLIGSALAFGSVLSWGTYTILAKRIADADAIAVTAVISLIGTVMLLVAAAIEHATVPIPSIGPGGWAKVIFLGAFASAVAYLLYNRALRDLDASLTGTFINLSPVIGVVAGVVFLGESVAPLAILGGALVLAGVVMGTGVKTLGKRAPGTAQLQQHPAGIKNGGFESDDAD